MKGKGRRLAFAERLMIEKLYKKNMSTADMQRVADLLGRNRTTILREIQRNKDGTGHYDAFSAQRRYREEQLKITKKQRKRGELTKSLIKQYMNDNPSTIRKREVEKALGLSHATVVKYFNEIGTEADAGEGNIDTLSIQDKCHNA